MFYHSQRTGHQLHFVGWKGIGIREDILIDFGPIVDTYKNMKFNLSMVLAETNFELGTPDTIDTSTTNTSNKNGCLIATAAYGSELSPQVQLLREVRDNVLFSTSSGTSFMSAFNQFYYSFSPTVADWERQSPLFKEIVKTTLTPMLSTLSILNYVNIGSEQEMLVYGIGMILLNLGMYFIVPVVVIIKMRSKFR